MTSSVPTRGQLERNLEQRIRALYRDRLGQRLQKVTCQFFAEKVAIVLEGATTPSEQFLLGTDQTELVEEFRAKVDHALEPQLKDLIEEVTGVRILEFLLGSKCETGFSSITVCLSEIPDVRDPDSIPKANRRREEDGDSPNEPS